MRCFKRRCGGVVVLLATIAAGRVAGQTISSDRDKGYGLSRRPWVGVSLGTGFVGSDHVEPDDSRDLALSLRRTTRVRVAAGRMGVKGADFGKFPLRRLTIDGVTLVPFPTSRRSCQSHFVAGIGIGLYHYGLEDDFAATERGYQATVGGECVGSRVSGGVGISGRWVGGPATRRLPDTRVFALEMYLSLRVRL